MIKKLIFMLLLLFCVSFTFGKVFNFNYYPTSSHTVGNIKKKGKNEYFRYEGKNSSIKLKNVNIEDINKFIKGVGYFKSFKYSYYFKNYFKLIKDNYIDLTNLEGQKLSYPGISVYIGNNVYFFVNKNNLSTLQKNKIQDIYKSEKFEIEKVGNWYRIILPIKKNTKIRFRSYDYKMYYVSITKLLNNLSIVDFQMGQDPLNIYNVSSSFSDYFIQISLLKNSQIKGLFVSLKSLFSVQDNNIIENHDQEYYKDLRMYENMIMLFDGVKDYYYNNLSLPNTINSLTPNYISLYGFNQYNHSIKYVTIDVFCYRVSMKPFSQRFKQLHSQKLDSDGYIYTEYCIK